MAGNIIKSRSSIDIPSDRICFAGILPFLLMTEIPESRESGTVYSVYTEIKNTIMAERTFKKEDFQKDDSGDYKIEFQIGEIGIGADLTVERINSDTGEREVIQPEIRRYDDTMGVFWSEPFDGRLLYDSKITYGE